MQTRCPGCMNLKHSPKCEHCGFDAATQNEPHQLPIGSLLRGQYVIGRCLGHGGFGITYLAWDQNLQEPVAIKEYFPNGQVSRNHTFSCAVTCNAGDPQFLEGRDRFLREAQTLAKLRKYPNIVQVMGYFSENNTAYIIMEYVKGITLEDYIRQRGGKLTPSETFTILRPVLESLDQVHKAGMIHRDISPDNIMLQSDGTVKLLDFGTARDVDPNAAPNHSTQAILKHGFAPVEQYQSRGNLGPWTDEYALCASVYYCLTGQIPLEALTRLMGGGTLDWATVPGLTPQQRTALQKGMEVKPEDRFPDLAALEAALFGTCPRTTPSTVTATPVPPVPTMTQTTASIPATTPMPPFGNRASIPQTAPMPSSGTAASIPQTAPMPQPVGSSEKKNWAPAPPETVLDSGEEDGPTASLVPNKKKRTLPLILLALLLILLGAAWIYFFGLPRPNAPVIQAADKGEGSVFRAMLMDNGTTQKFFTRDHRFRRSTWWNLYYGANDPDAFYEDLSSALWLPQEERPDVFAVSNDRLTEYCHNAFTANLDTLGISFPASLHRAGLVKTNSTGAVVAIYFRDNTWLLVTHGTDNPTAAAAVVNALVQEHLSALEASRPAADAWKSNVLRPDEIAFNHSDITSKNYPVFGSGYHRSDIRSVTFLDSLLTAPEDAWDVSRSYNRSVLAWVIPQSNGYELYIAGNGGVRAPISCQSLFAGYYNTGSIQFNGSFHVTDQVTDLSYMFYGCRSLMELDLTDFDTAGVSDMSMMFTECNRLRDLDLSGFDTARVTSMHSMFSGCMELIRLKLDNFNTANVTTMNRMFYDCQRLGSLDVTSFDTGKVTDMNHMFAYCFSLPGLDLSGFDTSQVTDMGYMFYRWYEPTQKNLNLGKWETENVTNYEHFMDDDVTYNRRPWKKLF